MMYVLSRTFSHSQGRLWTEPLQSQRTEQDWMLLHVAFGAVDTNVPFSMSESLILLHDQTSNQSPPATGSTKTSKSEHMNKEFAISNTARSLPLSYLSLVAWDLLQRCVTRGLPL